MARRKGANYKNFCVDIVCTPKSATMLRVDKIRSLLAKASQANKKPFLVIGFDQEDALIELVCQIKITQKKGKK